MYTSNCAKQTVWERCGCVDLASLVSRLSSINECPSQSDHVNQNVGWSEIMSNPSFQNYIELWQYLNLFISEMLSKLVRVLVRLWISIRYLIFDKLIYLFTTRTLLTIFYHYRTTLNIGLHEFLRQNVKIKLFTLGTKIMQIFAQWQFYICSVSYST